jgi:hypothetical protein
MRLVTLQEARERIDRIRSVYAPEELRVETNFIAVLLPTSLSLIASNALPQSSEVTGPVLAFLVVYLAAILFDLAVITGRNFAVRSLQEGIYRELDAARDESRALSADLMPAYDLVDAAAARRAYIPPMAKVLAAAMVAAAVWISF